MMQTIEIDGPLPLGAPEDVVRKLRSDFPDADRISFHNGGLHFGERGVRLSWWDLLGVKGGANHVDHLSTWPADHFDIGKGK